MKKLLLLVTFISVNSFSMQNDRPAINPDAEYNDAEMLEHAKLMGKLYFYQKNELRNKRQEARKKEHLKRKKQQLVKHDHK